MLEGVADLMWGCRARAKEELKEKIVEEKAEVVRKAEETARKAQEEEVKRKLWRGAPCVAIHRAASGPPTRRGA